MYKYPLMSFSDCYQILSLNTSNLVCLYVKSIYPIEYDKKDTADIVKSVSDLDFQLEIENGD